MLGQLYIHTRKKKKKAPPPPHTFHGNESETDLKSKFKI